MAIKGVGYTEGSGEDIAVDEVGGNDYQIVKLAVGAEGEASLIDNGQQTEANSLPVVLPASQITTLTPPAAITGYATSAKQDTIIGHVDGIETVLATIDTDTGAIATSTSSIDTKLSSQATATKQDTGNTSLASIDGKITACNTSDVTVSSSALPSGASTEATLALIKAKTDNIDVALSTLTTPSDQQHVIIDSSATITAETELPTAATLADATATPTAPAVGTFGHVFNGSTWDLVQGLNGHQTRSQGSLEGSGSVTSATNLFSLDLLNYGSISIQVTSAGTTCTITYEASNDNSTWVSVLMETLTSSSTAAAATSTTVGLRGASIVARYFRARVSTYTSGTVTASYKATSDHLPKVVLAGQTLTTLTTCTTLTNGGVANDAVDSGNPHKIGGQARTSNPTAVANADRVNAMFDKLGKLISVSAVRDLKGKQKTTITSSTSETTIITAAGASVFADLYGLHIANTSATACNVTIKDSTDGSTVDIIAVPAGETRGFMTDCGSAIPQATANNNWTATCSASVASIEITALYVLNL